MKLLYATLAAAVALALLAVVDFIRSWVNTQLPDFEEEEY